MPRLCGIVTFPWRYLEWVQDSFNPVVAHHRVAGGPAFSPGLGQFKTLDGDITVSERNVFPDQLGIFRAMMVVAGPAGPALLSVDVPVMQIEVAVPERGRGRGARLLEGLVIVAGKTDVFVTGVAGIERFRVRTLQQAVIRSAVRVMTVEAQPVAKGNMMREFLVVKGAFWRRQAFPIGGFQALVMAAETQIRHRRPGLLGVVRGMRVMALEALALADRAVHHRAPELVLVVAVKTQFGSRWVPELLRVVCLVGIMAEGTHANGYRKVLMLLVGLDAMAGGTQLPPFGHQLETVAGRVRRLVTKDTGAAVRRYQVNIFLFAEIRMAGGRHTGFTRCQG